MPNGRITKGQPHSQELDQAISGCLLESNSNIAVKFGFLKLGSHCNASASYAFTSAKCNIENACIKIDQNTKHYYLDFRKLFHLGLELLSDYKNESRNLNKREEEAIEKLKSFFEEKGKVYVQM